MLYQKRENISEKLNKAVYLEINNDFCSKLILKRAIHKILNANGYSIARNINIANYSLKVVIKKGYKLQPCQFRSSPKLIEKTDIKEPIKIVNIHLTEYKNTVDKNKSKILNPFFSVDNFKKTNLLFYAQKQDDLIQIFKDILLLELNKISY